MLEEDPRTRRSRCPLGLIGALILIIFVEIQISGHPRAVMGGSQWGYSFARRKADSEVKDCKVLCFGDSLLKQGLSPILIEAKTGLRAFNFAAGGGQAPGSYFLLRRALASGAHPSAIVVEYLPKLMSEHPNFNFQNWPFVATPLECFEMACIDRDPSLFTRLVLRQAIPSIRFRESIRLNLQLALEGRFLSVREQIDTATRHWEVNRGGEIQQSRPGRIEDLELTSSWIWQRSTISPSSGYSPLTRRNSRHVVNSPASTKRMRRLSERSRLDTQGFMCSTFVSRAMTQTSLQICIISEPRGRPPTPWKSPICSSGIEGPLLRAPVGLRCRTIARPRRLSR
jgi:hypothetical protein